jgi:hypothetical protein
MVLNLVRGRASTHGFTEISNPKRLGNGMIANYNIAYAAQKLNTMIQQAKLFIENKPVELSTWEIKALHGSNWIKRLQSDLFDTKHEYEQRKALLVEQKTMKQQQERKILLDVFLKPFAGTLTIVDLARLETL